MNTTDPVVLVMVLAAFGLVPMLVIVTTSFLKISVVLMLVRNALGIQQIPPNMAIYALSLVLTLYIMAPVGQAMWNSIEADPESRSSVSALISTVQKSSEPLRAFMERNTPNEQRQFFLNSVHRLWGKEMASTVKPNDFLILIPAYVVSELTRAFEIGFLLFLPFVIIDLVVSNILLAMGMMMVSPVTISLPLKLFLFVMVNGWTRLIQGLASSYV